MHSSPTDVNIRAALSEPRRVSVLRDYAVAFESQLHPNQRKRMGQFFTGMPLSRLLVAASTGWGETTAIDPMAGHGDLLDALIERSAAGHSALAHVEAIEISSDVAELCKRRLSAWNASKRFCIQVHHGNAFTLPVLESLSSRHFDLVITNPPYVRYQSIAKDSQNIPRAIRESLLRFVNDAVPAAELPVWRELLAGYSGHADLSVPAWLLSALLVRPGGTLALVVPATWCNRNYADVLHYLLARCYKVRTIIADRQPGWFSDALVRTHLLIATRRQSDELATPLSSRQSIQHKIKWVEIEPSAKNGTSLVGACFNGVDSEGEFARWLESHDRQEKPGIRVTEVDERELLHFNSLGSGRRAEWLRRLEPSNWSRLAVTSDIIPNALRPILGNCRNLNLQAISELGIQVSQGLRTGCNGFFYVDFVSRFNAQLMRVRPDPTVHDKAFLAPVKSLKTVLRRQSELVLFSSGVALPGLLLDLRNYILPEDLPTARAFRYLYQTLGQPFPQVMPGSLAAYVRIAAQTVYGASNNTRIPELSAVRTNTRAPREGRNPRLPRFWYMIPELARRHEPDVLIARINQGCPRAFENRMPKVIVDANFSTIWSENTDWSPTAIAAVLNSSWCRACMEAMGTPMAGGALKLEATHLRRLPVPKLDRNAIQGIELLLDSRGDEAGPLIDSIVLRAIIGNATDTDLEQINSQLQCYIANARMSRSRR